MTHTDLTGQVAIVTGASRGIGLSVTQRLVSEGVRVCITARHADALAEVVRSLPTGSAIAVVGNSDDADHRSHVFDQVASTFGRLDLLVNNVGINPVYGATIDLDLAAARKMTEVNLIATLAWIQGAYRDPRLEFQKRGVVVNMSSVTSEIPSPGVGFYGVTKAAISHLTRTLAAELGPFVRVNAIAPAVVRTQFASALYAGKEEEVQTAYPLRRLGTPEDVAALVAFLASEDASWITGQIFNLDGGLLSAGGRA